jgi:hypothetical protein
MVEATGFEPAIGTEPRHYPWPSLGLKCASLLGPLWLFRCNCKDPSTNLLPHPDVNPPVAITSFPGSRALARRAPPSVLEVVVTTSVREMRCSTTELRAHKWWTRPGSNRRPCNSTSIRHVSSQARTPVTVLWLGGQVKIWGHFRLKRCSPRKHSSRPCSPIPAC